ncbi:MAG: hypothetical protein H6842_10620 [Rhodospirillaceae bacterium]|nr:hypothetical protein [Rhodospirillaceae bacterium]
MTRSVILIVAVACLASTARAQSFPGEVEAALVGDWACGDSRVYITRLGSIEVIGDAYRAGLIDTGDGVLAIEWDDGERADWHYSDAGSDGFLLTGPTAEAVACRPRE